MADAALISGLLSNLAPLVKDEFSLFWNFKKEVEKLSSTLSAINAVLEDAERKTVREKDKQTEDWLRKLKDVLYEVRDIMDECTFQDLRLQVKRLNASTSTLIQVTNSITLPLTNTWKCQKIAHKIKDVQVKLDQISKERQNLHLRESIHDSKIDKFTGTWRETMSLPSCNQVVYGRDKEKKQIIDILLNNSVVKQLSVLPVVGIGGLGKTTLAQMVFNDDEVSKHFDTKFWVCVSDEFDIKLVIKAIIGANNETSLEILQKMIQDKLRGKRYLIVLDDVWNENKKAWNDLRSILDCGSDGAFALTTTRKRKVAETMGTIDQHFELSSLSQDDCWSLLEELAFVHGKSKPQNFIDIGKEIARKCKGVPLVAKTLGSQLGSNIDENEWCRIRDSEIWEIFQNDESDLLPILRLSYYDLPYHLRRCFVFCAIFPKDTEMKKERLIQLWMAHGLIPTNTNEELEDVGNKIWKGLCWRSFFQDEKENIKDRDDIVYTTCMMHDLMHDLAQSVIKDECYTMNANISSDGLGRKIRHLTVNVGQLDDTSVCSIKKMGGLQSIMLNYNNFGNAKKKNLSVLKKLPSLRVLEVRHARQLHNLQFLGCLNHLRYLDISQSRITTLPNSICNLLNLQTLNLTDCYQLQSLPRNTKNLISLRHLHLNGCCKLQYMPRGMGQLKYLKRLSLFVISEEIDHGQLDELKDLDIDRLIIKHLRRVGDARIKTAISMTKMSSIDNLELDWGVDWGDLFYCENEHEKIFDTLEISPARLKKLIMRNYKGVNPPKWVGKSSSLSSAIKDDINEMIVLFPVLEELHITSMKNLRELVSPPIPSPGGAFPNLCRLHIGSCPKLGALPVPHLKALKEVTVLGECSDELLYSISNLSALTHLSLLHMDERSVLFPAKALLMYNEISSSSTTTLTLGDNNDQLAHELGVRSTFQSLQSLDIEWCFKLRRLFDSGMTTFKISGGLTELNIWTCPKLMISVEEFGKLNINNSLQRLIIRDCPKLVSSEEAGDFIAVLRSLRARLGAKNFKVAR